MITAPAPFGVPYGIGNFVNGEFLPFLKCDAPLTGPPFPNELFKPFNDKVGPLGWRWILAKPEFRILWRIQASGVMGLSFVYPC